jgi:hypothetical protein
VRPIVCVDIDGTLGDYHSHLISFALEYTQKNDGFKGPVYGYDGSHPFGEWFCDMFDCDMTTFRQIKLAYRQGGMKRSMPIFDGAAQFVNNLRVTHEVWLTTTRPYLRLDNVDPDTRFWLERHGIGYDGMLYDEDKYPMMASMIDPERVVGVLDDLPEQIDAADNAFAPGVGILRRNRYNRGVRRPFMTDEFDVAQQWFQYRGVRWREGNFAI